MSDQDVAQGTTVGTLAPTRDAGELPFIAARVNNDLVSLSYPLAVDSHVEFVTMTDPLGFRVYRRSLCFLLAMAVRDLSTIHDFAVEHSFGLGLYCSLTCGPDGCGDIEDHLSALEQRMQELVAQDLTIERRKLSYTEALETFRDAGQLDQLNLLRFRNPPHVVMHRCGTFDDVAHGPLAPSTGALNKFALIPYPPGFVLHMPSRHAPDTVPPFEDQPHLFQIFQEHKKWGRILQVNNVGRLNETITAGKLPQFIHTAEALHEKKLSRIADMIADRRGDVRVVLVAGPSSAGKTTFSKRLTVHLCVNGLRPVVVSTDDYFVPPERNPVDENGQPDYEHLEAVDIELFNEHLNALVAGERVSLPSFNFTLKQREYHERVLQVTDGQVLIIEGIHGLNPRLTHMVPDACKFRIYVSALTQLNMDQHNRISTTDNRLMRRIVRDMNYRGHSALQTLRMWSSVRRGEKRWIFPFQREADATFNSALDYELAVLKPRVEPLLMQVKPQHHEYAEARRLSEFLINFLPASAAPVPHTSILREYIGGSSFDYS